MMWYIEEKIFKGESNATLQDMHKFLILWHCVCGTCILCEACIEVVKKLKDEEE